MSTPLFTETEKTRDPRDSWPSVTRVLKLAGLSPWVDVSLDMLRRGVQHGLTEFQVQYILQGVDPAVLSAKAELGKLTHSAISDIEGGMVEPWWMDTPAQPYVEAYLKFKSETDYKAISVEQKVYNETYRYNGTYDSFGTLGKYEAIIDAKTVVRMADDLRWQLAGYDLCLPPNPKRMRFGLQLKADATYQLYEYKDRTDAQVFLAAVAIAHAKGAQ
jgi:hypothetical protein